MSVDPTRRARLLGLGVVAAAFAAGVATGLAVSARTPLPGIRMTFEASDRIPDELTGLKLTEQQRERIIAILRAGRPRVFAVMEAMEPRMRAVLDSTDAEIAAVLDPAQRASWAAHRRGPTLIRDSLRMRR